MRRYLTERAEAFGALGQAALDLVRAETRTLNEELRTSGRRFLVASLLLVLALFTLFWALAVLIFALYLVAALWLPGWGAASAVLGLLLVVAAVLGTVGWRRIKRLETPAETVKRRARDYQRWWERRVGRRNGDGRLEESDETVVRDRRRV